MEKINDQIDQYLLNTLTAKEKLAFEEQLQQDEALQEEIVFRKKLLAGLEQLHVGQLVKRFVEFEEAEITPKKTVTNKQVETTSLGRSWRILLFILLFIFLAVTAFFIYRHFNPSLTKATIYAQHFTLPDAESIIEANVVKGDDSTTTETSSEEWKAIVQSYQNVQYTETLQLLTTLDTSTLDKRRQAQYLYLLGVLKMENGDFQNALPLLNDEKAANPTAREWYRALALLQMERPKEEIRAAFLRIAEDGTHPWRGDAKVVLELLKNIHKES